MRYSFTMRTFVHSSLFGFLAASAVLITSSAFAQDAGTEGGTPDAGGTPLVNCDPTTLLCSNGAVGTTHKAESTDRLPTDIDSGWMPACDDPNATPPCGKAVQVRAMIALDPPRTGGPVYSVDMTKDTVVDLHWDPSNTSTYTVSLAKGKPSPAAGKFMVAHTLTPEISIAVDTSVYQTPPGSPLSFDMTSLINYLPDSQFYYYATGTKAFPTWGFTTVENQVTGTDLDSSKLIGVTFEQIASWFGLSIADYAAGEFSLHAATDSKFTYQTTQVNITQATPLTIGYQDGTTEYPIEGGDEVTLQLATKGIIRYEGTLQLKFNIGLTSVAGFPLSANYAIDVYETPYGSDNVPVTFPAQTVKIPIPNVFVPSSTLDFKDVPTGTKSADQSVEIENTGKLGALLQFSSDDPQFEVSTGSATMNAEDVYVLKVKFKPTKSGLQQGTITVTSNDPDEPIQTIKVRGNGVGEDLPPEDDAGTGGSGPSNEGGAADTVYDPGASNDGGCGCTTAPTGYGNAIAGLALAGLGLAFLRRKRQ